ncbi:MAG TPA: CAP domain-containing protein [Thermoanaerobaculia bacterium]|nr:CAP domain-containing protein [Thermoanaerobaculia bacterium]
MKLLRLLPLLLAFAMARASAASAEDPAALRESFLARLNQERATAGLQALRLAEPLNRVAQQSAEEIRDRNAEPPGADAMKQIRRQLVRAGYEAHGWSHNFAAGPGDAGAIIAWWKSWNEASFLVVTDPDYQELGVGITDFGGTPLYTFLLAWREDEYFSRQTASLADLDSTRAGMLSQVNLQRAAASAAALALNPRLNEVAQRHAEDMLSRSYYDHQTPEGLMPRERVKQAGYEAFIVAENIARGPTSVEEAMSAWMQSQGHRGNLLHPSFTEMGVGCAVGKNGAGYTVLWVQEFGRPQASPSGTQ